MFNTTDALKRNEQTNCLITSVLKRVCTICELASHASHASQKSLIPIKRLRLTNVFSSASQVCPRPGSHIVHPLLKSVEEQFTRQNYDSFITSLLLSNNNTEYCGLIQFMGIGS